MESRRIREMCFSREEQRSPGSIILIPRDAEIALAEVTNSGLMCVCCPKPCSTIRDMFLLEALPVAFALQALGLGGNLLLRHQVDSLCARRHWSAQPVQAVLQEDQARNIHRFGDLCPK